MKRIIALLSAAFLFAFAASPAWAEAPVHAETAAGVSAKDAIAKLKEGNRNYVAGKLEHPHQTGSRRTEVAKGQHPFAIVLGCADSRVSPEVVFDQGLGDLFVIRVAGNVIDDHGLGSIEYAVEHLGPKLIVVLGHERCGAVAAARDVLAGKAKAAGHIGSLVDAIKPAVDATKDKDAEATVKANALNVAKELSAAEPVIKEKASSGEVSVLGAYYDLDTGVVTFLNEEEKK
jgi:carbonic anhydrase